MGITYHNEGNLLTECLESLLAESERPDEILLYDDASSVPARQFVPSGLALRVIRGTENRGPSHGRNALLRECSSEYVHFHDADDLFRPGWATRIRRVVRNRQPDAVFTEVASYRRGEMLSERVVGLRAVLQGEDLTRFCIRHFMLVPAGTYRRRAVEAIGGYRESLWQSEDFDFHIRLAASGVAFTIIDEPLVEIRIRRESRSQNRVETWGDAAKALRMLADELSPAYRPDLADRAAEAGSALYRLGALNEAGRAFDLARALGSPSYAHQVGPYRIIARLAGPLAAEGVASRYRRILPHVLRTHLRSLIDH